MKQNIISALQAIPVAELDRAGWITVGMALKHEGYPVTVWDEWSRNDQRYRPGECERLWEGFRGTEKPVTAGTILRMAKERGWDPRGEDGCMGWDDVISYDGEKGDQYGKERKGEPVTEHSGAGDGYTATGNPAAGDGYTATGNPAAGDGYAVAGDSAEELIRYLEAVFEPGDYVAFVTGDVWKNQDGRWAPGKGQYDRTAAEIIAGLRRHPEDMGATIGDWKEEAGAWIRFNPVDGKGVKNENVTKYRYALVESDAMPVDEQIITDMDWYQGFSRFWPMLNAYGLFNTVEDVKGFVEAYNRAYLADEVGDGEADVFICRVSKVMG